MPTVFSRIISGELPGRFVWREPDVVAFLSIAPIARGHVLVVPTIEVDHWTDLEPSAWARVAEVSRLVGAGIRTAFDAPRVGQMIAGFEVPHVHVHVFPAASIDDIGFSRADVDPDPSDLDEVATTLRAVLRTQGHATLIPQD